MFANVKIGDANVPMLAVASVNLYYKRTFGVDPIILQADKEMSAGENIQFYMQMGYIMAQMAAADGDGAKMLNLNEDTYIEWLSRFDNSEYLDAITAISEVYNGQNRPTSKEKKENE